MTPRTAHNRTHGMSGTREYWAWNAMVRRCHDPRVENYERYGGRGISVCPAWRHSFAAFFAALGARPSPNHSLDRIDNRGNYEPGNVRWATDAEQRRNRSDNVWVLVDGARVTMTEAARSVGLPVRLVQSRLARGATTTDALYQGALPQPKTGPDPRKASHGESNGSARLTAEIVRRSRLEALSGISIASLAKRHGVSIETMRHAVNRKTWRHVP